LTERVLLIGGPSHAGKSTLAGAVADYLGWSLQSTDNLGRHPGRPWGVVRPRVADHYLGLTDDLLVSAYVAHYRRMWPLLRRLINHHRRDPAAEPLVLEGSGLRPEHVAELPAGGVTAIWLTAPDGLITQRVLDAAGYAGASRLQRVLVDRFLMRTLADRTLTEAAARDRGFTVFDVSRFGDRSDLLGACLDELSAAA
jgi:hypothetical protein